MLYSSKHLWKFCSSWIHLIYFISCLSAKDKELAVVSGQDSSHVVSCIHGHGRDVGMGMYPSEVNQKVV
jgi:hypothetical protein